jgi:hypothetical protein
MWQNVIIHPVFMENKLGCLRQKLIWASKFLACLNPKTLALLKGSQPQVRSTGDIPVSTAGASLPLMVCCNAHT